MLSADNIPPVKELRRNWVSPVSSPLVLREEQTPPPLPQDNGTVRAAGDPGYHLCVIL